MASSSQRTAPLAWRTLQAFALMLGFYLLALGIVSLLLWLLYLQIVVAGRLSFFFSLFCVVSAGLILSAVAPRREPFNAPGPLLSCADYPHLHAEVEKIAQATGQRPPAEIYLVHDMSAWVSERGGFLGLGRKRIMGLGLPLLETLSRAEVRAVLVHEFAHYAGGDTALSPWLFRTRAAMTRTVARLAARRSWLNRPFIWYGNFFLRTTMTTARQQEFAADRLAAELIGADAIRSSLRRLYQLAPAYGWYWAHDVAPALSHGVVPPITEGFTVWLSREGVQGYLEEVLQAELTQRTTSPYDSHPSLKERLDRLARYTGATNEGLGDETDAPLFWADPAVLEQTLAAHLTATAKVQPVAWEDLGPLYLPGWRERLTPHRGTLANFLVRDLPRLCLDLDEFGKRLLRETSDVPEEARASYGQWVLGVALATTLSAEGWTAFYQPGQGHTFRRGEVSLAPFTVIQSLAQGQLKPDAWFARCETLDLSDTRLGA